MRSITHISFLLAVIAGCCSASCETLAGLPTKLKPNLVYVMGTMHGEHLTSKGYDLKAVGELIRSVDPEIVLVEIPPDRFDTAWQQFLRTGHVEEERVKLYPEFTEVLFPLALEGRFRVVPCSGWTAEMAAKRSALLQQWKISRPSDTKEVDGAELNAEQRLEAEGLADDPLKIHTAAYDAIVAEGLEPYERIFARDLGPGGWTQINLSHAALIEEALDEISGEGRRVLVIFGAWHKYRLRELLAARDDIELRRPGQ